MFMYSWLHNLHVHACMDHNGCICLHGNMAYLDFFRTRDAPSFYKIIKGKYFHHFGCLFFPYS
jgi:hypothetical protein